MDKVRGLFCFLRSMHVDNKNEINQQQILTTAPKIRNLCQKTRLQEILFVWTKTEADLRHLHNRYL